MQNSLLIFHCNHIHRLLFAYFNNLIIFFFFMLDLHKFIAQQRHKSHDKKFTFLERNNLFILETSRASITNNPKSP